MKLEKVMDISKKVVLVEAVFVLGILGYLFFSTAPSQVYPLSGMVVIEPDFVFEIEYGREVIISVDENFTNPIILSEGSEVFLPLGTYFWKVRGNLRESEVRNFTIQGNVALNLKEKEESYLLENVGNVDLNVSRKRNGLTSDIVIEVGDSKEVEKDDSAYTGGQI